MTSQHFVDGWDNWGEDWGGNNPGESNSNQSQNVTQQQLAPQVKYSNKTYVRLLRNCLF